MTPLTTRKIDAASGLASATRIGCSSRNPRIPTGIVAKMISHASRSVDVSTLRLRSVEKNAPMTSTQVRQK